MFKIKPCHRGLLLLLCVTLFLWSSAETDVSTNEESSLGQLQLELIHTSARAETKPTAAKPRLNGFTPYPTFVPGQSPQPHSAQQQVAGDCSPNNQCETYAASDELYVPVDQQLSTSSQVQHSAPAEEPVQQQEEKQQEYAQQHVQVQDSTLQPAAQQPASEAVSQHEAHLPASPDTPQPAPAAQPQAQTSAPPATPAPPQQPVPHPARRLLNLALLSDGASVLAANPEARRPERAIDKDIDSFMKNDCNAPKWIIIELSQLGTVETLKLTMKELYSSRVHTFRVFGRSTHPRKDGPDLTASIKSASWQQLGTFAAENKRGTQSFSLPQRSRVRYILLVFDTHYGNEVMCALNMIEVLGVSAAQELEEALALQEELDSEELFQQMQQQLEQDEQQALQQDKADQQRPMQHHQLLEQASVPVADVPAGDGEGRAKLVVKELMQSQSAASQNGQQQQQQRLLAADSAASDTLAHDKEPQQGSSAPQDAAVLTTTITPVTVQRAQPTPGATAEHPRQGSSADTVLLTEPGEEAKQPQHPDRPHNPQESDVIAVPIDASAGRDVAVESANAAQGQGSMHVPVQRQLPGQQDDSETRPAAVAANTAIPSKVDVSSSPVRSTKPVDSPAQQQHTEVSTPLPPAAATAAGVVAPDMEQASKAHGSAAAKETAEQSVVANRTQGADIEGNAQDAPGSKSLGKVELVPDAQQKVVDTAPGAASAKPGSPNATAPAAVVTPVQSAGIQQGTMQQATVHSQQQGVQQQQQQQQGMPTAQQPKAQQPARDTVLAGGTAKPKQAGNLFDVIKSEMMQLKLEQGKVHKKLDGLGKRDGEREILLQHLELQQSRLLTQLDLLSAKVDGLADKVARAEVIHQHNTHHHHHHHTAGLHGSHVGGMPHTPGAQQEHSHSLHVSHGTSHLGAEQMLVCQSGLVPMPLLLKQQYLWGLVGALAGSATIGLLVLLLHPSAQKLSAASRVCIYGLAMLNLLLGMTLSFYLVVTIVNSQQRNVACQVSLDPLLFVPKHKMIGNGSAV